MTSGEKINTVDLYTAMLIKVILLVLFLAYSGGLFYGGMYWAGQGGDKSRTMLASLNDPRSSSFANLRGQIKGKVTKVEDTKIYIEPEKGGQAIFSLPNAVLVSEIKDGKVTELGREKSAVKVGENALITIAGFNNGFAVTAVSYTPASLPLSGQMKELNQ